MFRSSRCLRALVEKKIVEVASKKNVAVVTLNDPANHNALSEKMSDEFLEIMSHIRGDMTPNKPKCIVITGAGEVFSKGGDPTFLRERIDDIPEHNVRIMRHFYDRFLSLRSTGVPVVAALNGDAIGAGFCVALACDIRVVSDNARLAVNYSRLGVHPGMGVTHFLPRLAGMSVASRLLLTGDSISAQRAQGLGLVSSVHPAAEVMTAAMGMATSIATASSYAMRETLATLRKEDPTNLEVALQHEGAAQAACYAHGHDLTEGLDAMKEKRHPTFK